MLGSYRKVSVVSSVTNTAKSWESSAQYWSELQEEIRTRGLSLESVDAIMNPGKLTLVRPEAELHTGDCKIYLVPTKNKAGSSSDPAELLANDLVEAIRKASRKASQKQITQLKAHLIEEIEEFYNIDSDLYADDNTGESESEALLREADELS